MTAISPPGAVGSVPVSVSNSAGTSIGGYFSYVTGLVENGSFESPVICPTPYQLFTPGSSGIPGWTVGGGGVAVVCNNYFSSEDGTQSVNLASGAPGSVSQTVATTEGDTYNLSMELAVGGENCGAVTGTFDVWWDGSLIGKVTLDSTGNTYCLLYTSRCV